MVSLKYPAIYTDSIGCEKCTVYLCDKNFQLKVRGFYFYSDQYDFDFYCEDINETKKHFYLKDNELIDYVLDIRIKIPIIYNNTEYIEKAILRIERQKNYYNNRLIIDKKNTAECIATGVNFKNIIYNLKSILPNEYEIKTDTRELLAI